MPETPVQARLILPTDAGFVPVAQAFARTTALRWLLSETEAQELGEATGEAVQLIMRLAFSPEEMASLELVAQPEPGGLRVIVRHKGLPLYADELEEAQAAGSLPRIRSRVDAVEFQNHGLDGLETHLVKFREVAPLGASSTASQEIAWAAPQRSAERIPAESFVIRPLEPEDAAEVARCVYRCYGYSYESLEAVYYPERLTELNRTGQILSLVATTPAGKLAGHVALERESRQSCVATAGVAVVQPCYRASGLGQRLGASLVEVARSAGLRALTAFAVTSHVFSQKLLVRFNFQPCCVVLGTASYWFRGIREEAAPRESMLGAYLNLGEVGAWALYPPMRHRAMVETICRGLGWACTFQEPEKPAPQPGSTRLQLQEFPARALARLSVDYYGEHVIERVRHHLRYLRLHDYKQFTLYLPLTDPNTYFLTAAFEKLGFLFAGVVPREAGPTLMLQYLHGIAIDYDKIMMESPLSREILSYIKYLDPEAL